MTAPQRNSQRAPAQSAHHAVLSRDYLEFQADCIEAVLAAHDVPARVQGGSAAPRRLRFLLDTGPADRAGKIRRLRDELALALGEDDLRVSGQGHAVTIDVSHPDPQPIRLQDVLGSLSSLPPLTACLGLTVAGRPLLLRLPSPDVVHVLVAGAAGSGKTELLRTLVLSLALTNRQAQLQIVLIDPKQGGLAPLSGLPHLLADPAYDVDSAGELLEHLVAEMARREREGNVLPHILVVVDELLDLFRIGRAPVKLALTELARRGGGAGIHLVLSVQNPSAAELGGLLAAHLPVRIVGRVQRADDGRIATGMDGTGAERLLGRGDFIAVSSGQAIRFQAAYVPISEWVAYGRKLRGGKRVVQIDGR